MLPLIFSLLKLIPTRKRSLNAIVDVAARLLQGVAFVMACIYNYSDESAMKSSWRWWLGRLCTIQRLLEEFHHEFSPKVFHELDESHRR